MRTRKLLPVLLVCAYAVFASGFGWFSNDDPPKLPVATITIDTAKGPAAFQMEIAADAASQERGLMFRKEMAPNAGMLFDMHQPSLVSFWMKNTYLSLDIIFVRPDGTISTIEPNAIPLSTDSIRSAEPVVAIIELNGGRAHQLGIKPGALVHGGIFAP